MYKNKAVIIIITTAGLLCVLVKELLELRAILNDPLAAGVITGRVDELVENAVTVTANAVTFNISMTIIVGFFLAVNLALLASIKTVEKRKRTKAGWAAVIAACLGSMVMPLALVAQTLPLINAANGIPDEFSEEAVREAFIAIPDYAKPIGTDTAEFKITKEDYAIWIEQLKLTTKHVANNTWLVVFKAFLLGCLVGSGIYLIDVAVLEVKLREQEKTI
jgi:hypothetical protein